VSVDGEVSGAAYLSGNLFLFCSTTTTTTAMPMSGCVCVHVQCAPMRYVTHTQLVAASHWTSTSTSAHTHPHPHTHTHTHTHTLTPEQSRDRRIVTLCQLLRELLDGKRHKRPDKRRAVLPAVGRRCLDLVHRAAAPPPLLAALVTPTPSSRPTDLCDVHYTVTEKFNSVQTGDS
jgi:hypothetical protein